MPMLTEALVNDLAVVRGGGLEPTLDIVTTHHDNVADGDGEAPVDFFALGDVCNAVLVVAEGEAVDENASGGEGQEADEGFEEGGLASAVGADDGDARAVWNVEGEVAEDKLVAVGQAGVLDFEAVRGGRHFDFRLRDG